MKLHQMWSYRDCLTRITAAPPAPAGHKFLCLHPTSLVSSFPPLVAFLGVSTRPASWLCFCQADQPSPSLCSSAQPQPSSAQPLLIFNQSVYSLHSERLAWLLSVLITCCTELCTVLLDWSAALFAIHGIVHFCTVLIALITVCSIRE